MANLDGGKDFENFEKYPNLTPDEFYPNLNNVGARFCGISYSDDKRDSALNCWLGGLPDLRFTENVKPIQNLLMLLKNDLRRFDQFSLALIAFAPVLAAYRVRFLAAVSLMERLHQVCYL